MEPFNDIPGDRAKMGNWKTITKIRILMIIMILDNKLIVQSFFQDHSVTCLDSIAKPYAFWSWRFTQRKAFLRQQPCGSIDFKAKPTSFVLFACLLVKYPFILLDYIWNIFAATFFKSNCMSITYILQVYLSRPDSMQLYS
jgi:hypothetical protein